METKINNPKANPPVEVYLEGELNGINPVNSLLNSQLLLQGQGGALHNKKQGQDKASDTKH